MSGLDWSSEEEPEFPTSPMSPLQDRSDCESDVSGAAADPTAEPERRTESHIEESESSSKHRKKKKDKKKNKEKDKERSSSELDSDDEEQEFQESAIEPSSPIDQSASSFKIENTTDEMVSGSSKATAVMNEAIPKKKRPAPGSNPASKGSNDNSSEDEGLEVSLNDLKRQVMGRDLKTEEDSDVEKDKELQRIRSVMNAAPASERGNNEKIGKSMSEKLRRDLMCSICHDIVYPPISFLCGHSFCQPCIEWWMDTSKINPTCPTCRKPVPIGNHQTLYPNLALRACVLAIYGSEIVQRIQAQRPKGERGGAHDKGYQVISPLEDETWHYVQTNNSTPSASSSTKSVQVRRSIVTDADDQRMQLALALYQRPEMTADEERTEFRIKLCLLMMEEDEAADSGFPSNIESPEDEQLICGRESRFLHSFVEVRMKAEDGSISPLARIPPDGNGYFQYVLDSSTSVRDPSDARGLLFEHTGIGCQLEVDLAQLQSRGGSTLRPHLQPNRDIMYNNDDDSSEDCTRGGGFVMGQSDDSTDEEDQEEFENDGFLVRDHDDDSDVQGEFSEDDEADTCAACNEHGELIVCDGGEEDDGCGKAYHPSCVNRSIIPEGNWICQDCANSFGIASGPEGHEFKQKECTGAQKHKLLQDDSDNEFANDESGLNEKARTTDIPSNAKRRRVLDDSDSD